MKKTIITLLLVTLVFGGLQANPVDINCEVGYSGFGLHSLYR